MRASLAFAFVMALLFLGSPLSARANSIPQCPTASLSFYDTSLLDGCLSGSLEGSNAKEFFWDEFSSPLTADPGLITVEPACFGLSCGLMLVGGTVSDIPSLDFQLVLPTGMPGDFALFFCAGPTGGTAGGQAVASGDTTTISLTDRPGHALARLG